VSIPGVNLRQKKGSGAKEKTIMRKLKLQVQISVDGYIAGTNGEMDWLVWDWDEGLKNYVNELTEPVDCIVLGRKLAQGFIPYWAGVAANPDDPQWSAGKKFTATKKVVFTKTLDTSEWHNTVLAKGDLTDEITNLKKQDGQDIIAYGGAAFVSALIKHGLIDEYHLFINPTAIGCGMTIFNELDHKLNLRLVKSTSFACGIVVLNYEPKHD
jgi:dihydrofolate reductase